MKMREKTTGNIIIGSGAAGYAAGIRLLQLGESDTVLITENRMSGTSRNTGSDKQTYYKLSLAGGDRDSVLDMAKDLFAGGCVDGDIALCEAALSTRGFFHLVELGVPFPCTEYGEYMGYKTDHDRGRRATSAGPYTSKMMTEQLEKRADEMGLCVEDHIQVIRLIVKDKKIQGVLALDKSSDSEASYIIYWCSNVILATGGPAGMYHDSVYPVSQIGSSGIAFEAGAMGKNLTEWQFGMASLSPRWNVSGTYMQVLPRFVSIDDQGIEHDFLREYFDSNIELLQMIFLKGYQWPFDVNKIFGGSSVIDLLVYQETILKNRRVYLDFIHNPIDAEIPYDKLGDEVYSYLNNAGACHGTPYERLSIMNQPAIDFYTDHGVDLSGEYLEIAVCAQHNNGGLATNAWYETDVEGLFAIGECSGSHGITRPGGTALNAGQVGAIRAAEAIAHKGQDAFINESSKEELRKEIDKFIKEADVFSGEVSIADVWVTSSKIMSKFAGMIRSEDGLQEAIAAITEYNNNLSKILKKPSSDQLAQYYHLRDLLISQEVYLSAMLDYLKKGCGSRGSALYTNTRGDLPDSRMPELYRCKPDEKNNGEIIQEIRYTQDKKEISWRARREIPDVDYFFENQWKLFRNRWSQ